MESQQRSIPTKQAGTVVVGEIKWTYYGAIRQKFRTLMGEKILPEIQKALQDESVIQTVSHRLNEAGTQGFNWTANDTVSVVTPIARMVAEGLPSVLSYFLNEFVVGLEDHLILGCVQQDLDLRQISGPEGDAILRAVFEVNDFSQLMELEKNLLGEIVPMVAEILGSGSPTPPDKSPGNAGSSPSSEETGPDSSPQNAAA